jgi:hypothetical protein
MHAPRLFQSKRKNPGFTLIEVLTVAGVTLLLFGLVIKVFFQSQDAVGHTVDKVESVQNARHLVDRLSPIVSVACDPSQLGSKPVTIHLPDGGLTEAMDQVTWLDITTTEDFLDPDFSSQQKEFIPLAELRAFRYRVEYQPDPGQLVLKRMKPDLTEDTEVAPRLLASRIAGLQFRPIINDDSLIEVRVRVEQDTTLRATGSNRTVETSAALHVPSESLR